MANVEGLTIRQLLAAYEGLEQAIAATLGVGNQPRAEGAVGHYLDAVRDELHRCVEPIVEAAKAFKPRDDDESQERAQILIRQAMVLDFSPEKIVEALADWNKTPWTV